MYFKNRLIAGEELASRLARYKDDDVIVATLSSSAKPLGRMIATRLRAKLTMLISKAIEIPGENSSLGSVDQTGHFSYNTSLSSGEIKEYESEYHNYLESEKMNKTFSINRIITAKGLFSRSIFSEKVVILVSDGLDETIRLDSAIEYLKPIRLKKIIIAVPVASVSAVDRMHIACDEIHCLSVTENYISANHYYDDTRDR